MFALQRIGMMYPEVIPRYGMFHALHARYIYDSVNWQRIDTAIIDRNRVFKRL